MTSLYGISLEAVCGTAGCGERFGAHKTYECPYQDTKWSMSPAEPSDGIPASDVASMAPKPVLLTTDKQARKEMPIARGVVDYFPRALAAIANVSYVGNQQHNPGQPMHWARGKSMDHADCIVRHLIERGTVDDDGLRHSAKLAWRALALLELELEAEAGSK